MRIISPHVAGNSEAGADNVALVLDRLHGQIDPFLIISDSEESRSFVQILEAPDGYVLEYQESTIELHFRAMSLLDRRRVEQALVLYTQGDPAWKDGIEFCKVEVRDRVTRVGHSIGCILGSLRRMLGNFCEGFRQGRRERNE